MHDYNVYREHLSRGATTLALVLLALCAAAALLAAPAFATEKHSFDPLLSLRGNCSTSALDEVPDPGLCPGTPGVDHPPKAFTEPCGTATDRHGDIYVSSAAAGITGLGTEGRIDVFNPQGEYLTEIKDEHRPCKVAVDSLGNVYVHSANDLFLFRAKSFPPGKGSEYEAPIIVREELPRDLENYGRGCDTSTRSISVDSSDDHLLVTGCHFNPNDVETSDTIYEYGSAAEGIPLLVERTSGGHAKSLADIAVWGKNHDIYASGQSASAPDATTPDPKYDRVFIFDGTDGHLKCETDGSESPQGFGFYSGNAGVAVDQANGDFYVDDVEHHAVVDQFDASCHYLGQLEHSFTRTTAGLLGAGLAVDDPYPGQAGYDSPNQGELYVAQGQAAAEYHLYAFAPLLPPKPPVISAQAPTALSDSEAILSARVNPNGIDTTYHFQYTTQSAYEADRTAGGTGYEHATAVPLPEADAGSGATPKAISVPLSGLTPGTAYRFRLLATNHCHEAEPEVLCTTSGEGKPGEEGTDATFATYGPEAGTPDGRGYELVSPPDTGGLVPTLGVAAGAGGGSRNGFAFPPVSADGESVIFGTEGGSLPGLPANGFHDIYEARRGPDGWQTSAAGLDGAQSDEPGPSAYAADHLYSFWNVSQQGHGTLPAGNYLRAPDGSLELVGTGSLATDPEADGRWIGDGGQHIIFASGEPGSSKASVQLEPDAPSDQGAIYERSADGPTEVLSLLPGDLTPAEGAIYRGTSADGSATAFTLGSSLYVRIGGAETQLLAAGDPLFAGISADGHRITYLRPNAGEPRRPNPVPGVDVDQGPHQGQIFSYDTETQQSTALGSGDEALVVNVSADGSQVYFLSPAALAGSQQNSQGQAAIPPAEGHATLSAGSAQLSALSTEAGAFTPGMEISGAGIPVGATIAAVDGAAGTLTLSKQATTSGPVQLTATAENLYGWDGGSEAIGFIATVSQRDVYGKPLAGVNSRLENGLGLWADYAVDARASGAKGPGADPSRTSADGGVLLFESRAPLTPYDNATHNEIYRYDATSEDLRCLSCTPTGVPPSADALLQSPTAGFLLALPPVSAIGEVINLSSDGARAFFQSPEPLVLGDTDEMQDVYEWEAPGKGSCAAASPAFEAKAGGCIYLISGGHSSSEDYLYGMTRDGSDVVFESGDLLSFEDKDQTPSLYDARVGGGFAEPQPPPGECLGEACQPAALAPRDLTPGTSGPPKAGNLSAGAKQSCAKGQRKVRRHGKTRCLKPHHKKHRESHRDNANRRPPR